MHARDKQLRVIDAHDHHAGHLDVALPQWDKYNVDRVVLFGGDISSPRSVEEDKLAFEDYRRVPSRVYPYFNGFPIYEKRGIDMVRVNLEKGYFGLGEVVGASTRSPMASKQPWKAQNPNDGNLPEIYKLCALYKAPILLHVDPPQGEPITKLEEALDANPNTVIIFGHANGFNSPANIRSLVAKHPNLYIDFFAGFTAYNPRSSYQLKDFVSLIEEFPDRFMLSTDSGYDIGFDRALTAMYETIDLLSPNTACKVAYQNIERILEAEPPTKTQLSLIKELDGAKKIARNAVTNKRVANEIVFALQKQARD